MGCWWQPGREGSLSTSTVQGRPERVRLQSERLMPPALSLGHRVSCSSAAGRARGQGPRPPTKLWLGTEGGGSHGRGSIRRPLGAP